MNPGALEINRQVRNRPAKLWRPMFQPKGLLAVAGIIVGMTALLAAVKPQPAAIGKALPAFAYRSVTLSVVQADGNPVAGAVIYGFCRDLNLVWPRPATDSEWNDPKIWRQTYLGKTDRNGKIGAKIPPGNWAFFATATLPGDLPKALVVWTDAHEPTAGETIQLAPTALKSWSFTLPDGLAASPKGLFFKPANLPIWIPVKANSAGQTWQVEMSSGKLELWGTGDSTAHQPGFALNWGTVDTKTPDGKLRPVGNSASLEFKGGEGRSVLTWSALPHFGLEDEMTLAANARVVMSTGDFTLGYRRPVAKTMMGAFAGEWYHLQAGDNQIFDLDTPLVAALDQDFPAPPPPDEEPDDVVTEPPAKLYGQLYMVDGNGNLLGELADAGGQPVKFSASLTIAGKPVSTESMPDKTSIQDGGQTLFAATINAVPAGAQVQWTITAPPGVLADSHFTPAARVEVTSATFKVAVPKILAARARNLLAQAEMVAQDMASGVNRTRKVTPTNLNVTPGHHGASASHNGTMIRIGTKFFFFDSLPWHHDFVHELGHNFGFTHGGLHETGNETTRCAGTDQISEQAAKWMFLDRMNGLQHKEVSYRNTGLYLYCYAQGGPAFLRFISLNEYALITKLKNDFTADEVATALLGLALGRDLTEICAQYGLKVTPEKIAQATNAARPLCLTSKTP